MLSDRQLEPDPELVAAGWQRRFIAEAPRAKEAMELYRQLGFEVRSEPLRANELKGDCEECRALAVFQFQTIYTRKK